MRVMAQMAMVMHFDKCIGCHTCSVTCKNVWTNRTGTEYVWFNNVETKPGQGYPRRYEDQDRGAAAGSLTGGGVCACRAGGRLKKLSNIFSNPDLPTLDDYYEPWTYDYETLDRTHRSRSTRRSRGRIRWCPASTWRCRGQRTGTTTSAALLESDANRDRTAPLERSAPTR